jgi:hypothetical protein
MDDVSGTTVKVNDGGGGTPMVWCSGYGGWKWRRGWVGGSNQGWDDLFHSSGEWESGGPGRVAYGGCADSILPFRLERGGDGTKRCQKIKRRQRTCLSSMGRKHDTVQWHDDVDRRRGSTGEGKGRRWRQLSWRKFESVSRSLVGFGWMMTNKLES